MVAIALSRNPRQALDTQSDDQKLIKVKEYSLEKILLSAHSAVIYFE